MNISSQIGTKVLTGNAVECCFHHTKAVLSNIESIRNHARQNSASFSEKLREHPQEAIMEARSYNNTISIVGSRGSGKTSVILTLQRILHNDEDGTSKETIEVGNRKKNESARNIIMPILVPQDYSKDQPLLSWIVSQLIKKAEEVEKEISEYHAYQETIWNNWKDRDQARYNSNPFRMCMDRLVQAYELRMNGGVNPDRPITDDVYHYVSAVQRDVDLVLNMLKLISMIVDYYRSKNREESGELSEPLIFFTIDDLDLAPDRGSEVLNLIQRYLLHPNVVVLCGWNQELFQNHLSIELLRNQGVLDSSFVNNNFCFDDMFMQRYRKRTAALDSARRLAVDNMKKAFPTAQRYEIRSLSNKERANFPFGGEKNSDLHSDGNNRLFSVVNRALWTCRYCGSNDKAQGLVPFLHIAAGDNSDAEEIISYMRIFDNKARGLTNVYKAFETFAASVQVMAQNSSHSKIDITNLAVALFDTIMLSNTKFGPYRRGIRDLVQIRKVVIALDGRAGELDYFCNYSTVEKVMKQYQHEKSEIDYAGFSEQYFSFERRYDYFPGVVIDTYLLLNFMENALRYITNSTISEHGGVAFSNVLNQISGKCSFTSQDDLLSTTMQLHGIKELPLYPVTHDFRCNLLFLNAYEQAGLEATQYTYTGFESVFNVLKVVFGVLISRDKTPNSSLYELSKEDSAWLNNVFLICEILETSPRRIAQSARLRNLQAQSVSKSERTAITSRKREKSDIDDRKYIEFIRQSDMKISDKELDALVECVRMLDRFTREASSYIMENTDKEEQTPKNKTAMQLRTENKAAVLNRLLSVSHSVHNLYLTDGSSRSVTIIANVSQYRKIMMPMFGSGSSGFYEELSNKSNKERYLVVADAYHKASDEIQLILSQIRAFLFYSFKEHYDSYKSQFEPQFRYSMRAASAVNHYFTHWELLGGEWGKLEIEAVAKLEAIFESNSLSRQCEIVRRIGRTGPKLAYQKRDIYRREVDLLREWVIENSSLFNFSEYAIITQSIDTLIKVTSQISRNLFVETELSRIIVELGNYIAGMCGRTAVRLFQEADQSLDKYQDADSEELNQQVHQYQAQREMVTPVKKRFDKEMQSFQQLLKKMNWVVPETEESTAFDREYHMSITKPTVEGEQ